MIKHCVFLRPRAGVDAAAMTACFADLAALVGEVPGLLDFSGGCNESPEGLDRGYGWGFVMTFADAASRDGYLPHPAHTAIASRLVALTEAGVDGILVVDFPV